MPNVDHVFIRHLLHAKIMFRTYGFCLRIARATFLLCVHTPYFCNCNWCRIARI